MNKILANLFNKRSAKTCILKPIKHIENPKKNQQTTPRIDKQLQIYRI